MKKKAFTKAVIKETDKLLKKHDSLDMDEWALYSDFPNIGVEDLRFKDDLDYSPDFYVNIENYLDSEEIKSAARRVLGEIENRNRTHTNSYQEEEYPDEEYDDEEDYYDDEEHEEDYDEDEDDYDEDFDEEDEEEELVTDDMANYGDYEEEEEEEKTSKLTWDEIKDYIYPVVRDDRLSTESTRTFFISSSQPDVSLISLYKVMLPNKPYFFLTKDMAFELKTPFYKIVNTALKNMEKMPINTKSIGEIVPGMSQENSKDMFYVSSSSPRNDDGASILLSQKLLKEVVPNDGNIYYILPSSIHEVILLKGTGSEEDIERVKEIVKECNSNSDVVRPEEVLTDEVFWFDHETNKLYSVDVLKNYSNDRNEDYDR